MQKAEDGEKTVTPEGGETEEQFVSRCIAFYVNEGRDQEQAAAICYRTWREGKESSMSTEHKAIMLKGLKVDETGSFKALFAPFNSIDKQGDLTLPGAFGKHQDVIISAYQHGSWSGALPVGKGFIYDGEDDGIGGGIVEGKFFLNTQAGKDTYTIVKELGGLQEWSYALPEIDFEVRTIDNRTVRVLKRITVNEVSPVLMGAGNGTRTLEVKGAESFGTRIEAIAISAEDIFDKLKGRAEYRESVDRKPSAADLQRARDLKAHLEDIARKLGEILDRHDAYTAAMLRFEKVMKGE